MSVPPFFKILALTSNGGNGAVVLSGAAKGPLDGGPWLDQYSLGNRMVLLQ